MHDDPGTAEDACLARKSRLLSRDKSLILASVIIIVWLIAYQCGLPGSIIYMGNECLPYPFEFDPPDYEQTISLEGRLPKFPSKMMVYKTSFPEITKESILDLGKRLAFSSHSKLDEGAQGEYCLADADKKLSTSRSWGTEICVQYDLTGEGEEQTGWASKEACLRIAEEYLDKYDLRPENACQSGSSMASSSKDPQPHVTAVCYRPRIDGYETAAGGATIWVDFAEGGRIKRCSIRWPEFVPYKMYPIKSPRQALVEVRRGKGVLYGDGRGRVEKVTLMYWIWPSKRHVQPIYHFLCRREDGTTFAAIAPAIRNRFIKAKYADDQ